MGHCAWVHTRNIVEHYRVNPADILQIMMSIVRLTQCPSVRALGETDLNPVSGLGKVSQLFFAWIQPGNVVANIIAGGVAEAGAQQYAILFSRFLGSLLILPSEPVT